MPTRSSVGEWNTSSALRSIGEALVQLLLGHVVEEFALDAERPSGQRHFDFALFADVVDVLLEQADDVRRDRKARRW